MNSKNNNTRIGAVSSNIMIIISCRMCIVSTASMCNYISYIVIIISNSIIMATLSPLLLLLLLLLFLLLLLLLLPYSCSYSKPHKVGNRIKAK